MSRQGGFDRWLVMCRPGFEGDTAAEMVWRLEKAGVGGHARTRDGTGLLEVFPAAGDALAWLQADILEHHVFPRQICAVSAPLEDLPVKDRLTPLLEGWQHPVAEALVETGEGDGHRELGKLTQKLTGPLKGLLQERGLWRPEDTLALRMHVVLDTGTSAWVGAAPQRVSSPMPGGIPRLRRQGGAPSRSALKLDEALRYMVGENRRYMDLRSGMTAVDLGAAPGGWTWVLRQWGLGVYAVDNGAMAPGLASDPDVVHFRADAFTFEPPRRVDWLVCDLVDKPARVVELMARWLRRGWADRALFNLKLPMRRRWQAVQDAEQRFFRVLGPDSGRFALSFRHLYHDREEITAYAVPLA